MARYILSIIQPDGEPGGAPPPPEFLEPIMKKVAALNADLREAGAWVFAAGLLPAHEAFVVTVRGGKPLITDGPFAETKEHFGGFTVIEAPDLDAARGWAVRLAEATTLPIEVREMHPDSRT